MSKQGVSKIIGPSKPKIGEKTIYKVAEWYEATPLQDRNESKVIWVLYKEIEKGKLTKITEKKGKGEFTFTQKAKNNTYVVEGYLHKPENKEPTAIHISPIISDDIKEEEEEKEKEKEIQWISLTYSDGAKITKALSYMDKLTAVAKCNNMYGLSVTFTLWEDDEKGAGHNPKNQFITQSKPIIVDTKGYARWHFTLLDTFIKLAQKREDDTKQHEYYVTVDYNGGTKASTNVNVTNPEHKISIQKKSKEQPKQKTTTQPQKNTTKVSTNPTSKNNTVDAKGLITKVTLTDKNQTPITNRPKFGEKIYLSIYGKNLKDKEFTIKIWEDDNTGENDLLNEGKFIFDKDDYQEVFIVLTQEMQRRGEYGNNTENPDSGEYWTGKYQEIFAEIIFETLSTKSQTINVDINDTFKANYDKSVAVVRKQKVEKNETPTGKCPNCEKDITISELQQVYTEAKTENLKELAETLNKYKKIFKLDTCARKAHFFAQSIQEAGLDLNGALNGEDLHYWADKLPLTFSKFRKRNAKGEAVDKNGNVTTKNKETVPNDLALKYGKSSYNNNTANPKMIASIAYSDKYGNGSVESGDGWKYRGRGLLQITWKYNYEEIQKTIDKHASESGISIMNKDTFSPKEAAISGMADWYKDKMYLPADETGTKPDNDVVNKIVDILNKDTDSRKDRRDHYQKTKVTFVVNSCRNINKEVSIKPISSKVIIKFGKNADQKVVNEKSLNLLREIGELTKNYLITITSTARDPYNQARVMYENIILNGMKEQRNTYASPGQKVLDSYESAKSKGKKREDIIKEMEAKIKELGSTSVSKHCVDPSVLNVFDVSIAGLSNPKDFKREVSKKVTKVLDENSCYHIEIKQ